MSFNETRHQVIEIKFNKVSPVLANHFSSVYKWANSIKDSSPHSAGRSEILDALDIIYHFVYKVVANENKAAVVDSPLVVKEKLNFLYMNEIRVPQSFEEIYDFAQSCIDVRAKKWEHRPYTIEKHDELGLFDYSSRKLIKK